jgi:hypothetical protein
VTSPASHDVYYQDATYGFEIHGLSAPESEASGLVYDVALARLEDIASGGGFPLTLFAIGKDLGRREPRVGLRAAAEKHEIANYDEAPPAVTALLAAVQFDCALLSIKPAWQVPPP